MLGAIHNRDLGHTPRSSRCRLWRWDGPSVRRGRSNVARASRDLAAIYEAAGPEQYQDRESSQQQRRLAALARRCWYRFGHGGSRLRFLRRHDRPAACLYPRSRYLSQARRHVIFSHPSAALGATRSEHSSKRSTYWLRSNSANSPYDRETSAIVGALNTRPVSLPSPRGLQVTRYECERFTLTPTAAARSIASSRVLQIAPRRRVSEQATSLRAYLIAGLVQGTDHSS